LHHISTDHRRPGPITVRTFVLSIGQNECGPSTNVVRTCLDVERMQQLTLCRWKLAWIIRI